MVTGFANDAAPFDTIGRQYSSPFFVVLIDLVGLLSFFGAALAIIHGGARIIYTVGRDGLFPRWTAWLQPIRRTPVGSITALCIFGLVIGLLLGHSTCKHQFALRCYKLGMLYHTGWLPGKLHFERFASVGLSQPHLVSFWFVFEAQGLKYLLLCSTSGFISST